MTDPGSTKASEGTQSAAVQAAGDTAGVAAEQSRNVAATATEQAKAVATTATTQARTVTDEARQQVTRVAGDASTELKTQMEQRLTQLVQSTRGASDQLRALHEGRTDEAGRAGDLTRQASDKLGELAGRADELGLDGVAQEVARFARRRPAAFLAAAAVAGVVAGRMMRSMQATSGDTPPSGQPSLPAGSDLTGGREDISPSVPSAAGIGSLDGPSGAVVPGETGLGVGAGVVGSPGGLV